MERYKRNIKVKYDESQNDGKNKEKLMFCSCYVEGHDKGMR